MRMRIVTRPCRDAPRPTCLFLAALCAVVAVGGCGEEAEGPPPLAEVVLVRVPEDLAAEDAKTLAADLGWSVTELEDQIRKQDMVDSVVDKIVSNRSRDYQGSLVGIDPSGPATIYLAAGSDSVSRGLVDTAAPTLRRVDGNILVPGDDAAYRALANRALDAVRRAGHHSLLFFMDSKMATDDGIARIYVTTTSTSRISIKEILEALPVETRDKVVIKHRIHAVSHIDWGPLAVAWGGWWSEGATPQGTIRITDRCVLMEAQNQETYLIVWPENTVRWEPESHAVVFDNQIDPPVALHDGDQVRISGVVFADYQEPTVKELPPLADYPQYYWETATFNWFVKPDPQCPRRAILQSEWPPQIIDP